MTDAAAYPVPLATAWTVTTLAARAAALTAAEITEIIPLQAALVAAGDTADAAASHAQEAYLRTASNAVEARARRSEFLEGPIAAAFEEARASALRSGVPEAANGIAQIFHNAAIALYLRRRLDERSFARCLWPIVGVIGEPAAPPPDPKPARATARAKGCLVSGGLLVGLLGATFLRR